MYLQLYVPVVLVALLVGTAAYTGRRTVRGGLDAIAAFEHAEMVDVVTVPRVAEAVEQAAAHGFAPVTRFRIRVGDAWIVVVLGIDPAGIVLEVSCGEDLGAPPPALACCSGLAVGDGALMTQTLGHLPSVEGELRQVLPGAGLAEVLDAHREGLAWLAARRIQARPSTPESAMGDYREWIERSEGRLRRLRWHAGLRIWWRMVRGRHLDTGPLAGQPRIDQRLDKLRTPA